MATHPVQVVLVDQRMPGLQGTQLLAEIKERYPDTIRLLITGYADLRTVIAAINEGSVYRYITKPWDPEELRITVAQAFEQYALAAERRQLLEDLKAKNQALEAAIAEREAALRLAQSRAELMAGLAHDLRNPLTVFLGYTSLLLSGAAKPLTPEQRDAVERMQSSARYMLGLINDTLDLVRVETGRDAVYPTEFAFVDVARQVFEVVRGGVAEKQLHLELDVPADLRLEADQIKLARILYNLVHNAVKFTPPGGRIVVRGRQEGDWFRLDVSDTGIGIAPEDQAHLFKQFVRLDDSSGRREVGIGLGLAVCHRLVSLHGGTITVESEPGKGSTFTVRIPRRCPATAPTP